MRKKLILVLRYLTLPEIDNPIGAMAGTMLAMSQMEVLFGFADLLCGASL